MWTLPLGPSVELPRGAANCVRGVPKWSGAVCGPCHWGLRWSSLGAHEPCEWCAEMGGGLHAACATGAFGGAPYGATDRVRGVPKWWSMGGGDACERTHWSLRWSSLWGHEPCEGCAKMGVWERRGRMRSWPLEPSVELTMGPRIV